MSKVGSLSSLESRFLESAMKNKWEKKAKNEKAEEKDKIKSGKKSASSLSENAKALLEELKKKYKNMDFMVASYDSDEEAKRYLSKGTKEYSVLIDPEELEKMAADPAYKEKNMAIIEDSTGRLKEMSSQLGDKEDEVVNLGVSIDKDGNVSYFAELQKMSDKQKEHIEKTREAKKEDAAKAAKEEKAYAGGMKTEKTSQKRAVIQADSAEELLEKIKEFNWDNVKEEKTQDTGSRFDFSI